MDSNNLKIQQVYDIQDSRGQSEVMCIDQLDVIPSFAEIASKRVFQRKLGKQYFHKLSTKESAEDQLRNKEYFTEEGFQCIEKFQQTSRQGSKTIIDLPHFIKLEMNNQQKIQVPKKSEVASPMRAKFLIEPQSTLSQIQRIPLNGVQLKIKGGSIIQMRSSSVSMNSDQLKMNKIQIPLYSPPLDQLQQVIVNKLKLPISSLSIAQQRQASVLAQQSVFNHGLTSFPSSPNNGQEQEVPKNTWKQKVREQNMMIPPTYKYNSSREIGIFTQRNNPLTVFRLEASPFNNCEIDSSQIRQNQKIEQKNNGLTENLSQYSQSFPSQILSRTKTQEPKNNIQQTDKDNSMRKISIKPSKRIASLITPRRKKFKKLKQGKSSQQSPEDKSKTQFVSLSDQLEVQQLMTKIEGDDYLGEGLNNNLNESNEMQSNSKNINATKLNFQDTLFLPSLNGIEDETDSIMKSSDLNHLQLTAKSVCIFDASKSKSIVMLKGKKSREIASLTKIMTCYIICQAITKKKLHKSDSVKVTKVASTMIGTTAYLRHGDTLSLWDLLYGLMLPSGNDAAFALAEHYGRILYFDNEEGKKLIQLNPNCVENCKARDAIKAFVSEMNRIAKDLGLTSTHYANPHGLMNKQNRSSAFDICKLSAICMNKSLFSQIVKTKQYTCQIKNKSGFFRLGTWENTNKCLLKYSSVCDGIKTGVTYTAGPCLTTSWKVGGKKLIITILKCDTLEQRYSESHKIFVWLCEKLSIVLSDQEKMSYEQIALLYKQRLDEESTSLNEGSTSSGSTK